MRVTEAMFQGITQRCLKKPHVIDWLNQGLEDAGITKQFTDNPSPTGQRLYEKLTFEGHEAFKLLGTVGRCAATGKMAVTRMLESMWPTGIWMILAANVT